jgi:sporulation protein YlmC with PRC-barrel domain
MLRRFSELRGVRIRATDGHVGTLSDVYFDDSSWRIRYCVVDTGRWLADRYVLVGPRSLSLVDSTRRELWVRLSKSEVMRSRSATSDKPVSRQKRGLKIYRADSKVHDRHLRSCRAVLGHRLEATDGRLGRVDDFMIDDKAWTIRNLVVDTNQRNAINARVGVVPQHVAEINWPRTSVFVDLSRAEVIAAETPS